MNLIVYALIAIVVALGGALGIEHLRLNATQAELSSAKAQVASVKQQHADSVARAAAAASAADARYRNLEAEMSAKQKGFDDVQEKEHESNARRVAALTADRDGLRSAIAAYAAPASEAGDAPAAACRQRATALGDLLDRAVQLSERRTSDAEDRGTDLRRLLADRKSLTCGASS